MFRLWRFSKQEVDNSCFCFCFFIIGDTCLYTVQTPNTVPELGDSSTTGICFQLTSVYIRAFQTITAFIVLINPDVRASNTGQTKSNADGTPWSVDSLLCEDIIDRVPLPKLQLLGIKCLVLWDQTHDLLLLF